MNLSPFLYLLIGAGLSLIGGVLGNLIEEYFDRRSERRFISISLTDELQEIQETIRKLEETWKQTKQVFKPYILDLSNTTRVYESVRGRLFVFKNSQTRKDIATFYKDLRKEIDDSEDKVGTLANTAKAKAEQETIKSGFCTLASEAATLINKLK